MYAQYRGEAFVSVLLLRFDLATGEVEAVDAGSPRLWRLRDRSVEPVSFEAQLPLGMFEDTVYTPQRLAVRPGTGCSSAATVYDAASPDGETYGDRALARALIATKLLPSSQVPGAVLRELAAYHGDAPLEDDALVVCPRLARTAGGGRLRSPGARRRLIGSPGSIRDPVSTVAVWQLYPWGNTWLVSGVDTSWASRG